MEKVLTILTAISAICFMWTNNAKANVYASSIETINSYGGSFDGDFSDGTGIKFSFFLNDTAKSVIIEVKDASNDNVVATIDAGSMSRGKQSVPWDGTVTESGKTYYYEITVEQDSYSTSQWEVFFDSGDKDIYSRGVDVIIDMRSPLFGVFMAPNNGGPLGTGITFYHPDGSLGFLAFPDPGDGSVWGTSSDGMTGGVFDDLNRFYVSSVEFGEIRCINLDSAMTTVIGSLTNPKGIFISGTGADRKIYVCDDKKVIRYDIGNADVYSGPFLL